jgi:hypothetical protein
MTLIGIINIWRSDANNRFGHELSPSADTWLDKMLTWQSDDAPGAFAKAASSLDGGSLERGTFEGGSLEGGSFEGRSREGGSLEGGST